MAEILKRLTNLEDWFRALINQFNIKKMYNEADLAAQKKAIGKTASGVSDNDIAVCDVADLADTNSIAIDDLAAMIDDLQNRVSELEG